MSYCKIDSARLPESINYISANISNIWTSGDISCYRIILRISKYNYTRTTFSNIIWATRLTRTTSAASIRI